MPRSLMMVVETETCRSTFNVNFNANFKIFLEYLIVHPLDKIGT